MNNYCGENFIASCGTFYNEDGKILIVELYDRYENATMNNRIAKQFAICVRKAM